MGEFLKDLPSLDRDNFSRVRKSSSDVTRTTVRVYLSTRDDSSERAKKIGTDKTNSLLRYYYLHSNSKQDHNGDDDANSSKESDRKRKLKSKDNSTTGPKKSRM
ncbi:DET1- and DDB1-associated protein 1 [Trichoplax sp. H2]|nr:DET1- and DDB1-associated protein 1 [Trichoplax sp. H2]|eukprot:RDD39925.1 DET1- and DDB1-associated protein 1 [Trichoplax sp. H2]